MIETLFHHGYKGKGDQTECLLEGGGGVGGGAVPTANGPVSKHFWNRFKQNRFRLNPIPTQIGFDQNRFGLIFVETASNLTEPGPS